MVYQYNMKYVISLAFVSALGGLLFGYDWVVIGGAKPFYEAYFEITNLPSMQGWAMSSALVGCLLGAIIAGQLSDRYGRKWLLIFAAVLFIVSSYGTGASNYFNPFIIYRIMGGVGIGLASMLSPLYIAEMAPAEYRGRLVSINQLTIVIGILGAQVINLMIAEPVSTNASHAEILQSWNGQHGWRWMFWAEIIPAFFFFFLMFLVPESPRFLVKVGKDEASLKVLSRIGGKGYGEEEVRNIREALNSDPKRKVRFKDITDLKVLPILFIGIVLAIFQQWCGINIIFNYAQEIFEAAGYNVNDMLFNIVITGSVNLVFTLIAMKVVDRWGRRILMLLGSAGLAIVYILIGSMYYFEITGWPVLVMVLMAIAIYAMTLAPITWVLLSEIFPNRIRGLAMSLATFFLWMASFVLTFSFPILNKALGASGTFWLYSIICISGFLFMKYKLKETKNKSLEEIEYEFIQKTR